jgi:hypothetical protein
MRFEIDVVRDHARGQWIGILGRLAPLWGRPWRDRAATSPARCTGDATGSGYSAT